MVNMKIELRPSGVVLGLVQFSFVPRESQFVRAFARVNRKYHCARFGLILGLVIFSLFLLFRSG